MKGKRIYMYNSSKGFIMIGSMIITLVIMGAGVSIFSTTGSMTEQSGQELDMMAAQTTNGMLRSYAGDKVRGSIVAELMGNISVWNAHKVFPKDITYDTSDSGLDSGDTPEANRFYTVEFSDTNSDTYYDQVRITAN